MRCKGLRRCRARPRVTLQMLQLSTALRPSTVTVWTGLRPPPGSGRVRGRGQVKVEITRIEHRLQIALVNNKTAHAQAVGNAIRAHLRDAEDGDPPPKLFARWFSPVDWYRGTSIEQAYRSLHAARVFLVELVADEDIDALVPGVLARVQSCLPATDPQRIELEKLPRADHKTKRAKLVRALERGYAASDEAHAHIRRFRNVLLCTAALIAFFTLLLVYEVAQHPAAVPLCFQPDITTAQAAMLQHDHGPGSAGVCPSSEQGLGGNPLQPSGRDDVWIVAGLGLLGGGLASAVSSAQGGPLVSAV